MQHLDYVVVGGGAAGAAAAYELSKVGAVVLIERETMPGYHSTGCSAAVISENYGPMGWRALVTASRIPPSRSTRLRRPRYGSGR